ncbi:MAG: hypothetical protein IBJ11_07875 [Phycisphaerales bacterium]|nr:hypothetical protein [Phycisphaerales bacterium]
MRRFMFPTALFLMSFTAAATDCYVRNDACATQGMGGGCCGEAFTYCPQSRVLGTGLDALKGPLDDPTPASCQTFTTTHGLVTVPCNTVGQFPTYIQLPCRPAGCTQNECCLVLKTARPSLGVQYNIVKPPNSADKCVIPLPPEE